VREKSHVAYSVDNLDEAARDLKVLLEPFEVGDFVRVGFYEYRDGTVVELMEYLGDESSWFDKKK
jgi:hypothetical protein